MSTETCRQCRQIQKKLYAQNNILNTKNNKTILFFGGEDFFRAF